MNKLHENSDELLLLMMAKDSEKAEKAFEELYIRYKNKIYVFCNFFFEIF